MLHFAVEDGRSQDRDGVCTGWLNDITKHLQNSTPMINASYEAESQSRLAEECLKVTSFSYFDVMLLEFLHIEAIT